MSKQKCAFCQKGYCHAIPVSAKLPQSSDTTEPHREKKLRAFFSVAAPPRKGEPLKPLTLFYKKGSDFLSLPFVFLSLDRLCITRKRRNIFYILYRVVSLRHLHSVTRSDTAAVTAERLLLTFSVLSLLAVP